MLDRCDFRTERECSCGPNQCRVQNIGTFQKSPPTTFSTTPITAGLLVIFTLGALWAGICEGTGQQKVIDRDRQEITAWAR